MSIETIQPITMEHVTRYGDIYAKAFSGEPWNDPWKPEDAVIHVQELMESKLARMPTDAADTSVCCACTEIPPQAWTRWSCREHRHKRDCAGRSTQEVKQQKKEERYLCGQVTARSRVII